MYEVFSPTYVKDELRKLRGQMAKVDPMFIEAHFRKSLTAFIRICEVWDIKPALMTLASRLTEEPLHESLSFLPAKLKRDFGLEYREYRRIFHRLNDVVREVGRENDVMVIDLAAQIPSDGKHLYDFYHLNNEGSELAARIIADKLIAGR